MEIDLFGIFQNLASVQFFPGLVLGCCSHRKHGVEDELRVTIRLITLFALFFNCPFSFPFFFSFCQLSYLAAANGTSSRSRSSCRRRGGEELFFLIRGRWDWQDRGRGECAGTSQPRICFLHFARSCLSCTTWSCDLRHLPTWCWCLCPFHHLPGSSHAKKEALCSVLLYVVLKQVTVLLLQHLPLISQRLKPRVLLSSLLHLLLHLLPSDSVLNSSSLLKILLPLLPNLTKVSLPSLLLLISLPTSISLSNNIYDDSGLDSFVDSILVHVLCPLSVSSIFLPFTLSPHKPLLSVPKT